MRATSLTSHVVIYSINDKIFSAALKKKYSLTTNGHGGWGKSKHEHVDCYPTVMVGFRIACAQKVKISLTTERAGVISSTMTELLFCNITVQWSFSTALRRGRKRERDKHRQREREREREYVCARRLGPAPAYPTLTAAACRVRSAAFPEGNAEDKEEEARLR